MVRPLQVLPPLFFAVVVTSAALAQSEFKPRPGPTAPAPTTTKPVHSATPGRGRVTTRVAVGERAPDFELRKLDGTPVRLSSLRGNWVMVYFVERRDSLAGVEPVAHALEAIGVRTVAIIYDKPQAIARLLQGRDPGYLPLADPTGEIVALYGLLDPTSDQSQPGFVLVTPTGVVRIALLGHELPSDDASRLVHFAVRGE
jgi:mycoredoxin-dependent peroxiredoxin